MSCILPIIYHPTHHHSALFEVLRLCTCAPFPALINLLQSPLLSKKPSWQRQAPLWLLHTALSSAQTSPPSQARYSAILRTGVAKKQFETFKEVQHERYRASKHHISIIIWSLVKSIFEDSRKIKKLMAICTYNFVKWFYPSWNNTTLILGNIWIYNWHNHFTYHIFWFAWRRCLFWWL